MKKTIGTVGVIVLSILSLTTKAQDTTRWDPRKNPTVDSLVSPYQTKLLPPRQAATTVDIFPAIGNYESSTNSDAAAVSITLDEQNKGIVWVAGLPQGKVKAMLRKSPATYKIPAQKTEEGKDITEGTLIFDKETNTLSICIGKPFNTENPAAAFAAPAEEPVTTAKTSKTKKTVPPAKAWIYIGTKQVTETVMK